MSDKDIIEPDFDLTVSGFVFVGCGPYCSSQENHWSRSDNILYRCVKCGILMPATQNDDFSCECGAMYVDHDMHRFGSHSGDQSILVYRQET